MELKDDLHWSSAQVRLGRRIGLAGLAVALAACTPEVRYEILCVFFEGVPRPGEPIQESRPRGTQQPKPAYVVPEAEGSIHRPFHERRCHECHDMPDPRAPRGNMYSFTAVGNVAALHQEPPELCLKCHEGISAFRRIHGPVANGICLHCHYPHASPIKSLLRGSSVNEICLFCHLKQNFTPESGHAEGTPGECTDCHGPHGGDRELFLRNKPAGDGPRAAESGEEKRGS